MPTLGEVAYNAYCEARGWRSVKGEQLPSFKSQSPSLQDAWEQAAKAVEEFIRLRSSQG